MNWEWDDTAIKEGTNHYMDNLEDTEETQVCYLTLYANCGDDQGFSLELLK